MAQNDNSFLSTLGNIGSSALSTGANSLVGGLISSLFQSNATQTNFNNQKELMKLQNQYTESQNDNNLNRQKDLISSSPLLTLQGYRAAGLNPAFMNGGSISANVATQQPNASAGMAGFPSLPSSDLAQMQLSSAQAKLAEQQAREIAIRNARETEFDRVSGLNFLQSLYDFVPDDQQDSILDKMSELALNGIPNKGTYEAYYDFFDKRKNEVNNKWQTVLTIAQQSNPKVYEALVNMPSAERDRILSVTAEAYSHSELNKSASKNQTSQADLNALEKEIKENSSVQGILDKLHTGNVVLDNIIKLFVLMFGSMTSFSIHN